MPTIIAKKIHADISHGNFARMRALIDYCSSPENSHGNEKCVFFRAVNFSGDEDDMTIQEIKDELAYDFSITKYRKDDVEKLAHWVLSLKRTDNNDKYHDTETLYSAAKDFIMNLGFDDNHKFTIAIHTDADHIHIHICISKVMNGQGRSSGKEMDDIKIKARNLLPLLPTTTALAWKKVRAMASGQLPDKNL